MNADSKGFPPSSDFGETNRPNSRATHFGATGRRFESSRKPGCEFFAAMTRFDVLAHEAADGIGCARRPIL
jgi:hypothetical protein